MLPGAPSPSVSTRPLASPEPPIIEAVNGHGGERGVAQNRRSRIRLLEIVVNDYSAKLESAVNASGCFGGAAYEIAMNDHLLDCIAGANAAGVRAVSTEKVAVDLHGIDDVTTEDAAAVRTSEPRTGGALY